MAITADEFLDRLEFLGLLDEKVLANLRRQVAESKRPVAPQTLTKLLVDNGQLTAFQAKKLLGEETAGSPAKPQVAARPASPLQDLPSPKVETTTKAEEPAGRLPASKPIAAGSKPVEDELGLAPSEEDLIAPQGDAKPPTTRTDDETAEIIDLIEVAETPAPAPRQSPWPAAQTPPSPAAKAANPASTVPSSPRSPSAGLTPLDAGAGLTPLDMPGGLTPLPASSQVPSNFTPSQPVDLFNDPLIAGGLVPAGQVAVGQYGYGSPTAPAYTPTTPPPSQKKSKGNQWDSPLLFVGGGGLLLLLIALVFLYWILTRGSADEIFQQAEEDYRAQSYGAALAKYDKFLVNFPKDAKASLARVRRGMCRLRPLVEAKDWQRALAEAQEVLPEIESETDFTEARAELATLLPAIAAGFAARARAESDTAKSKTFVDLAEEALKLVNNSAYIPTTLRTTTAVEPKIQNIQEDVALARRDINRDQELAKALFEIDAAVKAKKTAQAYSVRKQLIKAYPDLEVNADLHRAVLLITEGEREQVRAADKSLPAVTDDEAPRTESRVVLAATNGPGITGVEGRVVLVLARGAVYGLDVASGKVLWRRFVGFETKAHPQLLAKQPDSDALLVDGRRNEVVRVKGATGKLVWRLPVAEPFAGPIVGHGRMFISTHSGRVLQIDPQGGQALREASFPQSLAVEPGIDLRGRVLFQVGEHSNLYVLKVDTLACEAVFYTGHKSGSVVVPPLMSQGLVFVAENAGADYCLLHVIAADTPDAVLKEAQNPLRLRGRVLAPLAISGRRVLVVTDLGEISLLEIDVGNSKQPVSVVVRFGPTTKEPVLGFPLADEGLLWLADRRIAKYEIQTSRGELVRKSIKSEGDTFIAPLERLGDTVVQVRRRRNSTGVSVACSQIDSDQILWQTDLATPLAGPVQFDAARKRLVAISAYAEFFGVDQAAMQAGLATNPATVIGANSPGLTFTRLVETEGGKLILASTVDNERAVTYDPNSDMPTRLVRLTFPAGSAVGEPVYFRGGLLQPSSQGRVYLLDMKAGGNLMHPFQPRLEAGETLAFTRPAIIGDKNEFVVADSRKKLYRVRVKDQPQPFLAEIAQVETASEIVSPLAAAGDTLYAVTRNGASSVLSTFHLPDLKPGKDTPLSGRVTWGPESVGSAQGGVPLVFVATDADGLICLESGEKERWRTPLSHGALAGRPLADGADFVLASQSGMVWRVAGDTGKETARLDTGEPLAAGPVLYGTRLLLAGSDGVLHVVRLPAAAESVSP